MSQVSDKIKRFKIRRMERILSRLDAEDVDDEEGRWITTENGHKVHINGEGEPDKGNPHVIDKMEEGEKKKKTMRDFVDLIGQFPDTLEGSQQFWRAVDGYLKDAPEETKITFKDEEEEWVKIEDGHWMSTTNGNIIDADEMLEMFEEEEFGQHPGDDRGITYEEPDVPDFSEEPETAGGSSDPKRVGRSDAEKRITAILEEGYRSGYTSGETEEKLKKELDALPDGSVLLVKTEDWGEAKISVVKKTPNGYEIDGDLEEEDELIEALEESGHELDVISSDEFESVTIRGKSTHDLFKFRNLRWTTIGMLSSAPEGTEIRFKPSRYQGEDETILVRESGRWYDADLDMYYNDNDVYNYMRDVGFVPSESEEQASELVEYREPDKKKYVAKKSERHTFEGCTSFSDKADDTHSYAGDGQEQVDFFYENSNFDWLLSDLDEDQEEALRSYTEGELMRSYAHSGWDEMPVYIQDMVRSMDEVIDQATLDEGVVVTRLSNAALLLGYDNKQALLTELKAMVGKRVVSKGFMSCGAADEGLSIGNRHKMVEYKIGIPGGSVGAGMWLGDDRINNWGARQREFCLNRDTEYEVKSVNFDPERGIYTVALEYVGRHEHDYGE